MTWTASPDPPGGSCCLTEALPHKHERNPAETHRCVLEHLQRLFFWLSYIRRRFLGELSLFSLSLSPSSCFKAVFAHSSLRIQSQMLFSHTSLDRNQQVDQAASVQFISLCCKYVQPCCKQHMALWVETMPCWGNPAKIEPKPINEVRNVLDSLRQTWMIPQITCDARRPFQWSLLERTIFLNVKNILMV